VKNLWIWDNSDEIGGQVTGIRRSKSSGRGALLAVSVGVAVLGLGLVTPATATDEPGLVLEPTQVEDSSAPVQTPGGVSAKINRLANSRPMGKSHGTIVVDPGERKTLYGQDAERMLAPASSMKIPTALAALTHVGVDARIETRTVQPAGSSDVYLVGGGDPLLDSGQYPRSATAPQYPAPTSMKSLAMKTAEALKVVGRTQVKLKYDASLFSGSDWNPDWPRYFTSNGIVAPVQALMVDDARLTNWGPRSENPAKMAGERFATLLRGQGIRVSSVKNGPAPRAVDDLAVVSSAPMYQIVNQMLSRSDNDTAEALFRLAGLAAGSGASFQGGSEAVDEALRGIGITSLLTNISDGSGLSDLNRVSASILAEIVSQAVLGAEDLWPISDGLAVAGVTGTLAYRFGDLGTSSAAGLVRAKTGTLTGISSLSGFVHTKSGRVLVFASIANEANSSFEAAAVIDRIAAKVASCGCSKRAGGG
jgi:D-alanyl-D-alanine carboxypeptidase/D-alanyl-D-alanine-endopeptidase (penicillin-binding protein 4)